MSWTKLTPAAKKKITSDWNEAYSAFGVYKPLHLLRRVGPLLMGIALEKGASNDFYKPIFHVHNLSKAFPVISLSQPKRIPNEYVQVDWHESKYAELAERLKEQAYLPLSGDVTLTEVINGFYCYLQNPLTPFEPDVYKDLAMICGWAGALERAEEVVVESERAMKKWPANVLNQIGGLNAWLEDVRALSHHGAKLTSTCEKEIGSHKLDGIPACQLIA